jgi:hypothetical protein
MALRLPIVLFPPSAGLAGGVGAGGDFEARAAVFYGNKPLFPLFQRKKSI